MLTSAFTIEDLDALPDDGSRHELIGGAFVMTPPPEPVHERASVRLLQLLLAACPPEHEVFTAPVGLELPGGQQVEPDLVIAPDDSVLEKRLVTPVLLVVEIVSPGSVTNDRVTKRSAYAEAGIPAYWLLEPNRRLGTALRLTHDGEYETYAEGEQLDLEWPVVVSFSIDGLVLR